MPENFESLLSGIADSAGGATRPPGAAAARLRGRQRTLRQRFVASTVPLALLGVIGGVALASGRHSGVPGPVAHSGLPGTTSTVPGFSRSPSPVATSASPSGSASTACVPITDKNAPTADPAAVARILAVSYYGGFRPWSARQLNYIALVDQAARSDDLPMLDALLGCGAMGSNARQQSELWKQPGVLAGLITVLEKTHAEPTDGLTFPGFLLTQMTDPYDVADLEALGGIGSDGRENFVSTQFNLAYGKSTCQCLTWGGVRIQSPARPTKVTAEMSTATGGVGIKVATPTVFTVTLTNFTGHDYASVAPSLAVIYGGMSVDDHKLTGEIEQWDPVSSTWKKVAFPYPPLASPISIPVGGVPLPSGATASFKFRITITTTPDISENALAVVDVVQSSSDTVVGTMSVVLQLS